MEVRVRVCVLDGKKGLRPPWRLGEMKRPQSAERRNPRAGQKSTSRGPASPSGRAESLCAPRRMLHVVKPETCRANSPNGRREMFVPNLRAKSPERLLGVFGSKLLSGAAAAASILAGKARPESCTTKTGDGRRKRIKDKPRRKKREMKRKPGRKRVKKSRPPDHRLMLCSCGKKL